MSQHDHSPEPTAEIGVIGGSGFYALSDHLTDVVIETPYGPASDPLQRRRRRWPEGGLRRPPRPRPPLSAAPGAVPGKSLGAALPRGAPGARALCRRVAASGARARARWWFPTSWSTVRAGAPRPTSTAPSPFTRASLIPSARTFARARSLAATAAEWPITDGGAMVVIEGPRFSTRAESQWYSAAGWSLVNMTALPEAALARELGMCFASVALVTDRDAGVETGPAEAVTQEEVFRFFAANVVRLRALIGDIIERLPPNDALTCRCGADVPPLPAGS